MKKNANLPALIFMFALLIAWQCIAMGMNAAYILPSPTQVLVRLWELRKPLFTAHLPATMLCTGVGLAISIALGLLLAIVMDASPSAEKMLYPLIVASQTIPTTALAPLFVLWFGYTIWSKVLVTVLITFFPIAMTVFDGFRSAKTDMIDMLKTFGAGQKEIFLKLKIPAALPYFFSALKMAIPMSIIGAAIGEWLGTGGSRLFQPPHDDATGRRRRVCTDRTAERGCDDRSRYCKLAGKEDHHLAQQFIILITQF